ncbi:MAG: hypothetical protein WDO15_11760 [Bacteroidota bacterium]
MAQEFASIINLHDVNGTVYFAGDNGSGTGVELWKTNSVAGDAVLVTDINKSGSSNPGNFFSYNGVLYFKADDGHNGKELWKCEGGTSLGTKLVKDIYAGPGGSNMQDLTESGGRIYFTASDKDHTAGSFGTTDGTDNGTSHGGRHLAWF